MIKDGAASRIQEVSIKPESKCVFLVLPSKIFNRLLPASPEKKMPEVGLPFSLITSHKSQGILDAQGHFWWLGKLQRRSGRERKHGEKAEWWREGEVKMEAGGVEREREGMRKESMRGRE